MSTQSTDLDWVCKAQKAVNIKVRNRLSNKSAHQLRYCYHVNRRLIKKIQDEKEHIANTRVGPEAAEETSLRLFLLDNNEELRE